MKSFRERTTAKQWPKKTLLLIVFLAVAPVGAGWAQTPAPETVLRQSLAAHAGAQGLPADLTIQGQVTDTSGTRALRMRVKGKDKLRYELGVTSRLTVSIFNAGAGWTGPETNLKPVFEHAAVLRRAVEVPFLDVTADVGDSRFRARDLGQKRIGTATVHHFALRLIDPIPVERRFLRRPLHQDMEIFIDASTNLIVRTQRMQAADNSMDFRVPVILDFSDYRQVGALAIPFRIVTTIGNQYSGIRQSTLVIQSVLVNQGIADSVFRPQ